MPNNVTHCAPSLPGTYLRGYGIEKLPVRPQFSQLFNVPGYFTATVEKALRAAKSEYLLL